jgi:hypothetical protein
VSPLSTWIKLHKEEPYDLHSLSSYLDDQIEEDEMYGACGKHGRERKYIQYRVFVGRPEGKRSLVRSRHRWEDNITMEIKKKQNGRVWTGFIWLRTWTSCRLLRKR